MRLSTIHRDGDDVRVLRDVLQDAPHAVPLGATHVVLPVFLVALDRFAAEDMDFVDNRPGCIHTAAEAADSRTVPVGRIVDAVRARV